MKPLALYFHGDGALSTGPVTAAAAGSSSFSEPAPSQSGDWTARPAPGTWVSYTTPPLSRDVDFFGPGSVNLWLSSSAPDTDIEVISSEVRPDGQEQYIQAGWLDVAKRKLAPAGNGPYDSSVLRPYQLFTRAAYEPLAPGHPVYARVELLPFEHVFRKGSSIRVTIDSATGPSSRRGTGGWRVRRQGSGTPSTQPGTAVGDSPRPHPGGDRQNPAAKLLGRRRRALPSQHSAGACRERSIKPANRRPMRPGRHLATLTRRAHASWSQRNGGFLLLSEAAG